MCWGKREYWFGSVRGRARFEKPSRDRRRQAASAIGHRAVDRDPRPRIGHRPACWKKRLIGRPDDAGKLEESKPRERRGRETACSYRPIAAAPTLPRPDGTHRETDSQKRG